MLADVSHPGKTEIRNLSPNPDSDQTRDGDAWRQAKQCDLLEKQKMADGFNDRQKYEAVLAQKRIICPTFKEFPMRKANVQKSL